MTINIDLQRSGILNVVKTWKSYTITTSPDLPVETQMERGERWWITWDGVCLREWVYATDGEINESGKVIEDLTGDIAVKFEGNSGVSTSQGHLFVCQGEENTNILHARETFYTTQGNEEVICFFSKLIADIENITILSEN